jgi:hypothetical protein
MSNLNISATIEVISPTDKGPVILVCFEDERHAYWLQFNSATLKEFQPLAYEVGHTDYALLEGIIWGLSIGGSEEGTKTFEFMRASVETAGSTTYVDQLMECVERATPAAEMVITIWHRNQSRYNISFVPSHKNLKYKVLAEMTDGFPEDNA